MKRNIRCVDCSHLMDYHNAFSGRPCGVCDCNRLRLPDPEPPKPEPKPRTWKTEQRFFEADSRACEKHAREVLRQIEFYQHNGAGDEIRVLFIASDLRRLAKALGRWEARYRYRYEHPNDEAGR